MKPQKAYSGASLRRLSYHIREKPPTGLTCR